MNIRTLTRISTASFPPLPEDLEPEDEFKTSKKLSILAVGDDDQNIYQFRGANTQFIKKFESDYEATRHNLLQNYRSSANIIQASNELISQNVDRMKTDDPIRINDKRKEYPLGEGGRASMIYPKGLSKLLPVILCGTNQVLS